MTVPLHQYASVPLALTPETVCERLVADPQELVRRATADALTAMGPHLRRWGQTIAALPTTTARTSGSEALGCVELVWAGAEEATGWPALTGHLVVSPAGQAGSRLRLFSHRSPHGGLASSRLDPLHGQRIVTAVCSASCGISATTSRIVALDPRAQSWRGSNAPRCSSTTSRSSAAGRARRTNG
jgi:hypothetical protein